jgi:hypothetical protein
MGQVKRRTFHRAEFKETSLIMEWLAVMHLANLFACLRYCSCRQNKQNRKGASSSAGHKPQPATEQDVRWRHISHQVANHREG